MFTTGAIMWWNRVLRPRWHADSLRRSLNVINDDERLPTRQPRTVR